MTMPPATPPSPPGPADGAQKAKTPLDVTLINVSGGLAVLGLLLPWVSFGIVGLSGVETYAGLLALAGAVLALVFGFMAYSRKQVSRATGLAAIVGGLIAAGMAVYKLVEIQQGYQGLSGLGQGAEALANIASIGSGIYLTIAGGIGLLGIGAKLAASAGK